MFSGILIYLPAFMECFILYRVMSTVLVAKNKYVSIGVPSFLFGLMYVKQQLVKDPELIQYGVFCTILIIVIMMSSIYFFTKNSFIEKVTWFLVYYFILFVIELILMIFITSVMKRSIGELSKMDQLSLAILSIGKILTYLLFEYIIKKKKGKMVIGVSYFKELVVVCFFNIILLMGVVFICYNKQHVIKQLDDVISVFLFLVFLITAYTVALIFRIERKSNEELETQLKLQQIELELKLNNDIVDITDKLRKLRHDMNNHIGILKALTKSNKYAELEEYIDQMYEDVELANDIVITSNKAVAVLLNAKKSLAKQMNIEFSSFITDHDYNMLNKDICSLLANILDNAIEAAANSRNKKFVQLMIQKTEEGNIINCENSFGIKPIMKKGRFITNKDNDQIHGIGTENIKYIVKKYNGEINFDYDDEIFNIRVVIPA